MSSLQTIAQISLLIQSFETAAQRCFDKSFELDGYDIPTAQKVQAAEEMGKHIAYKLSATMLKETLKKLETAQDEEAANA